MPSLGVYFAEEGKKDKKRKTEASKKTEFCGRGTRKRIQPWYI